MAMKVHSARGHDMDCFIRECAHFFSMIDDREVIYPCIFAFNFSNNVLILFFNVF